MPPKKHPKSLMFADMPAAAVIDSREQEEIARKVRAADEAERASMEAWHDYQAVQKAAQAAKRIWKRKYEEYEALDAEAEEANKRVCA